MTPSNTPLWVKASGLTAAALLVRAVGLTVAGHDMGRHLNQTPVVSQAAKP